MNRKIFCKSGPVPSHGASESAKNSRSGLTVAINREIDRFYRATLMQRAMWAHRRPGPVMLKPHLHRWVRDMTSSPPYTARVKKSKLRFLSKYVNKTEKIGGTWTNTNSYRENEALSDIFTCLNIVRLKAVDEITARQTRTSFVNMTS